MQSSTLRRNSLVLALSALLPAGGCFSSDAMESAETDTEGSSDTSPTSGSSTTGPGTSSSGTTTAADASTSTGPGGSSESSGAGSETDGDTEADTDIDPSDTDGSESSGSTGDPPLVPEVVETTPANNAAGVHADASIEIVFSEAMDKVATQAAFQSSDLPAAGVTFAWNDSGDTLTITPIEDLVYAVCDEVSDPAQSYAFTITTTAQSESGVALASNIDVEFTTLRHFLQYFPADGPMTGAVRDLGGPIGTANLGDTSTNDTSRFFVTFDVSAMAPEVAEVQAAEMTVTRGAGVSGNPFSDLGGVAFQQARYDALDGSTYDIAGIGPQAWLFPTADGLEQTVDVASGVENMLADPDTYGTQMQYRILWYPSETDNDSSFDSITINENTEPPLLGVLYLAD